MKEILLSQGKVAQVDDGIYEWLSAWKWGALKGKKTFYARRMEASNGRSRSRQIAISLHKAIWEHHSGRPVPEGFTVDHIDRDGLNNQYANLRLATRTQQSRNQGLYKSNTSGYIGISFNKKAQKYMASLRLGFFDDPEEAARARDRVALFYYEEFAVLNFPLDIYTESD